MTNLLLNPNNFKDEDNHSPASIWNGAEYHFLYGIENPSTEVIYTLYSTVPAAVGDSLKFNFNEFAGCRMQLRVSQDGTTPFDEYYYGDNNPTAEVSFTKAGNFTIEIMCYAGGSYAADAILTPFGTIDQGQPPVVNEPPVVVVVPTGADTLSLKGFVSIGSFANNVRDEVATLGELSLESATYAKDRGLYAISSTGANPTTLGLSVFSCRTPEGAYEVPTAYSNFLMQVIKWCHQQAINGVFTNNAEFCRQAVMAEFDGKILNAVMGEMATQDGVWLPSNMTFYLNPESLGTVWTPQELEVLAKSRIKLWFSDAAFATQYDEFDIEFLAPIANDRLDDFFLVSDQVVTSVAVRTMSETMILIHALKDSKPETKIRTINFPYHDPLDPTYTLDTDWTFVIYGAAGDNIDSIKETLGAWILANSTHDREEWAVIFPDIFTSTEFIVTPLWNQYAIPNETLGEGVYSPTVNVKNSMTTAYRTCVGAAYTNLHIDKVLAVVPCVYKSLSLLIVGGPENRDRQFKFQEIWPDYIAVFTSSLDYNRMQPNTQRWIALLHSLLLVAETMTDFSDLPQNMTRLKRTNPAGETYLYAVASFDNVQYLVASRLSVQQYFPPTTVNALQISNNGVEGVIALPSATLGGAPYQTFFKGLEGVPPYTYGLLSISNTSLFANAALNAETGEFTGEPQSQGDIQVTAKVTDSASTVAQKVFTLHIMANPGQ